MLQLCSNNSAITFIQNGIFTFNEEYEALF